MAIEFFQTRMGQKFFCDTMPKLVNNIEKLTKVVEESNKIQLEGNKTKSNENKFLQKATAFQTAFNELAEHMEKDKNANLDWVHLYPFGEEDFKNVSEKVNDWVEHLKKDYQVRKQDI